MPKPDSQHADDFPPPDAAPLWFPHAAPGNGIVNFLLASLILSVLLLCGYSIYRLVAWIHG